MFLGIARCVHLEAYHVLVNGPCHTWVARDHCRLFRLSQNTGLKGNTSQCYVGQTEILHFDFDHN